MPPLDQLPAISSCFLQLVFLILPREAIEEIKVTSLFIYHGISVNLETGAVRHLPYSTVLRKCTTPAVPVRKPC